MIVSRHKLRVSGIALLAGTYVLAGGIVPAQAWQEDTTEQPVTDAAQPMQQAAQPDETAAQKAAREARERYFLGGRPKLKRQMGPALGAPRSILPQPYLPKGSVTIPPAPVQGTPDDQAMPGEGPMTGDAVVEGLQADEQTFDDPQTETQVGDTPAQDAEDAILTEGLLETLDPSGMPVLDSGAGYPADFWQGYDRADIVKALTGLATPSKSPAMTAAARKVVLSGFTLARPNDDREIDTFVKARLDTLAAHGDRGGYLALIARLPLDHDWSPLSRAIADGHLLAGRIEDACVLASQERADSNDPYWLRMAAFCRAVRGDRVGVDFQLGILEELSEVPQTFYQLIDQILVEAAQASGPVLDSGLVLSSPLRVDVLEATMARIAKAGVPLLADSDVHPLAAKTMLDIPSVDASAKLRLIGRGIEEGWISSEHLADYMAATPIAEDMAMQALEFAETDDSFLNDVLLMALAGKATDEEVKAQALAIVAERVQNPDKAAYMLPVLARMQPDNWGLSLRAALLGGALDAAYGMFNNVRASSVGDDAAKDAALASSWPLITLAGFDGAPAVTLDRLMMWWAGQADKADRFARAALLFTLLEATGHIVPAEAWAWAEAGDVQAAGPSISPAHWRKLLMMASNGDRPGVLLSAYQSTAAGTVSASYAGSLVGALMELGLHEEAHRLAAEIAIRRGL